jgi:hypothetical protein
MARESSGDRRSDQTAQDEYMRGGKGRKDEVGKSGIYPASSPDAPADALIRGEGELVSHSGPRSKPTAEHDIRKSDLSSGSE